MEHQFDRDKVLKWFEDKWKGSKSCPICGHSQWTAINMIFETRRFSEFALHPGGPLVPMVVASCANCGYIVSFNAVTMGLVLPDANKQEDASEKEGAGKEEADE